jgi:hypothetical protein
MPPFVSNSEKCKVFLHPCKQLLLAIHDRVYHQEHLPIHQEVAITNNNVPPLLHQIGNVVVIVDTILPVSIIVGVMVSPVVLIILVPTVVLQKKDTKEMQLLKIAWAAAASNAAMSLDGVGAVFHQTVILN